LNGDAEVTNECHAAFIDPGVTANDACAGPVSNSVRVVSTLDTNTPGVYTLTYFADDGAGNTNAADVIRIVHVEDHTNPSLSLTGGSSVTNECHVAWVDPGFSASDDCAGDLTSQIVVDLGGLDTNSPALGTYTITYSATDSSTNSHSVTRSVTITDTQAPQITLQGSNPATAECHVAYGDAGATASDLCAGSLTSQIQVDLGGLNAGSPALGTYTITYTVNDGNGNSATNTRTVIVTDTLAPVITLNGAASTTTCQTHSYTDLGASANDTCAGVLSPVVSGTVNTNVAGTYTLTYTFDDGNGQTAVTNRVVTVQPCEILISQQPVGQILNAGDTLTLSVVAVPPQGGSLSYQWYHGATAIPLATGPSYSKADVKNADAGNYHVTLTSGIATQDSDTVAVTVSDPYIVTPPASYTATVVLDKTHTFSVVAKGTSLKYQWYKQVNGVFTKILGVTGTNTFYTASVGIASGAGTNYMVQVYNSLNTNSATAHLTILSPPTVTGPATMTIRIPVFEGNNTRFPVVATSPHSSEGLHSGNLHYQWGTGGVGVNTFIPLVDNSRHVGLRLPS